MLQSAAVRRVAFAFIVAFLTISVSGASSLIVREPCSSTEAAGTSHETCPPTCITCGCCAQAVEPVALVLIASPDVRVEVPAPALPQTPESHPRDILHVPKARVA